MEKFSKSESWESRKLSNTAQGNCEYTRKGRIISIAGAESQGNCHIGGDIWFES